MSGSNHDDMLLKMKGTWSGQTIVYGPIWPLICKVLSYLSFGNLGFALFIYKLFNLLLHFANTYFVYKITNQSKKYSIMYALNPLILFEGLSNVHNEMLVIFFILGAFYCFITKKKMLPAIALLACATAVKYFAILLAPFFVLYYYRKETLMKKIGYSLLWTIVFILILGGFYSIYMQDFEVLKGVFVQQKKFANSFLASIAIRNFVFALKLSQGLMIAYIIIYIIEIITVLVSKKEYTWESLMQKYNQLLVLFLFATITNLQPWYFLWVLPTIFWQKENKQKLLQILTTMAIVATSIYFLFTESYIYGQYYSYIIVFTTILTMLIKEKKVLKK